MNRPAPARSIAITVDGERIEAVPGVPLGAILHERRLAFRHTARDLRPRALFCGMGVCFDCLVTVDGRAGVRACITAARDGMRVELG